MSSATPQPPAWRKFAAPLLLGTVLAQVLMFFFGLLVQILLFFVGLMVPVRLVS
jgi:hypothetical protein